MKIKLHSCFDDTSVLVDPAQINAVEEIIYHVPAPRLPTFWARLTNPKTIPKKGSRLRMQRGIPDYCVREDIDEVDSLSKQAEGN